MWIEVCDKLINFDKITVSFESELEQVHFNLLERIKSKPIDGFRHEE